MALVKKLGLQTVRSSQTPSWFFSLFLKILYSSWTNYVSAAISGQSSVHMYTISGTVLKWWTPFFQKIFTEMIVLIMVVESSV